MPTDDEETTMLLDHTPPEVSVELIQQQPLIMTLENVLSEQECERIITWSEEEIGYDREILSRQNTPMQHKRIRSNARAIHDSPALADAIWERISHLIPEKIVFWRATGLNERLRLYRYDPGNKFIPHHDGPFRRDAKNQSQLTVLIYLNEGFEGGQTRFPRREPEIDIIPSPGRCLIFAHKQWHEGVEVLSGHKYALRTDVMYTLEV
jgi:hypothetical protein